MAEKPDLTRRLNVTIPKVFLEEFIKEPRIILKPSPGLWPVDLRIIKSGLLEKIASDRAFQKEFEVMIVPKV